MKVSNLRLGFATNSSSSHSVVIVPKGSRVDPRYEGSDFEYGWEWFVLPDVEHKMKYLATQLALSFEHSGIDEEIQNETIKNFTGVDLLKERGDNTDSFFNSLGGVYIDHESVWGACHPTVIGSDQPEIMLDTFRSETGSHLVYSSGLFWPLMKKLLMSKDVVVVGGNDNDTPEEGLVPSGSHGVNLNPNTRIRIDKNALVFFDSRNGTKVRLTEDGEEYSKSTAPELVDLKITDYCDKGCAFCYQGSTRRGNHAPFDKIVESINMLSEMGVFEVAIGGGEPTTHPQFAKILKILDASNIVPNFTTYTDEWTKDEEIVKAVAEHTGGIGVSIQTPDDFKILNNILETMRDTNIDWVRFDRIIAQHVVGSCPVMDTVDIIQEARTQGYGLLLLGYKEVGRGKKIKPHDFSDLPFATKIVLEDTSDSYGCISVDTALLDTIPTFEKVLNINPILMTKEEGKFSCYIDAVTNTMGPSSYADKSAMEPMTFDADEFTKTYAKW